MNIGSNGYSKKMQHKWGTIFIASVMFRVDWTKLDK